MKKSFLIYALAGLSLTACMDDHLFPEGDDLTEESKEDLFGKDPSKVLDAEMAGLAAELIKLDRLGGGSHDDYGFAAICQVLDQGGADFVSPDIGYNWFQTAAKYKDRDFRGDYPELFWKTFYTRIKAANDLLNFIDAETEDKTLLAYRGQAYASRAFDYLYLVQLYQLTYVGHELDPAVPIVLETSLPDDPKPRATVQAVYDQILSDLDIAIGYLDGFSRADKSQINLNVALGLRARTHLLMQNWSAAAADAAAAKEGFVPYKIDELLKAPKFTDSNDANWMFANIISETNDVVQTGIINWPSHLGSFNYGYAAATGSWREINKALFAKIPATDVRKGWWVDENLSAPYTDAIIYEDGGEEYNYAEWNYFTPYTNVKFGPYKGELGSSTNASDWPVMRVEEMILIEAEAKAMSGDLAGGQQVLTDFLTEYRDPSYTATATSPTEFQDEVWLQRRIELWGEGFALLDILRLKKPLERVDPSAPSDTNYPPAMRINLKAEDPLFVYPIPKVEVDLNNDINTEDNNDPVTPPTPIM